MAYDVPEIALGPAGIDLLEVLALELLDRDLFRTCLTFKEDWPLYGGQVVAQALLAAGKTVDPERLPHSLHCYFLRPGDSRKPVVFAVDRDRDGGSFSARRVVARQDGEVILNLASSFAKPDRTGADETSPVTPPVEPPGPTRVPARLISFEESLPTQDHPAYSHPTRFWLRCTAHAPDDALLDAAVLAYQSDISSGQGSLASSAGRHQPTIDHAMWFHRRARVGQWVLSDLQSRSVSHGRGLYTGNLWTQDGRLVASLAQETLYRLPRG